MKEAMQKKEKQEGTDQHKQKKGTGKSPQDWDKVPNVRRAPSNRQGSSLGLGLN
jgi:hypothetical protein